MQTRNARPAPMPAFEIEKPTFRGEGRREYLVRCRVPFVLDALFGSPHVARVVAEPVAVEGAEGNEGAETRAAPVAAAERKFMGPAAKVKGPQLDGIASSTGKDSHGTEMSERALRGMEAQFNSGKVAYLPHHPSYMGTGGEWDDIIGYVGRGMLVPGDVPEQYAGEPGFALRVEVQLDERDARSMTLAQRVEDGYEIGQSIGGWFTEVRYIYKDGDDPTDWMTDPERIVIEAVELDHLAATRSPSNTASWIEAARTVAMDAHTRSVSAVNTVEGRGRLALAAMSTRAKDAPGAADGGKEEEPEEKAKAPVECAEPVAAEEKAAPVGPEMKGDNAPDPTGNVVNEQLPKPVVDEGQGNGAVDDASVNKSAVEPPDELSAGAGPMMGDEEEEDTEEVERKTAETGSDEARNRGSVVDTASKTGESTGRTGTDVQRGAPGVNFTDPSRAEHRQEHNMSMTEAEIQKLKDDLAAANAEIARSKGIEDDRRMIERSSRRGKTLVFNGIPGTRREVDELLTRARDEGAEEVVNLVSDAGFIERSNTLPGKVDVGALHEDLRSLFEGAEDDGLIVNPFESEAVGRWGA